MREINPKQQMFVRHFVAGGNSAAEAARLAGYSPQYAKRAAQYLNKNAKLKAAIAAAQADIRSETGLTAAKFMRKLEDALNRAYSVNQMTAAASLLQLQGKVAGLLVDRVQVETIDISGALIEARRRGSLISALAKPQDAVFEEVSEPPPLARQRSRGASSTVDVFE